jgi:hypothetical protein
MERLKTLVIGTSEVKAVGMVFDPPSGRAGKGAKNIKIPL